jgi:short-subunit dehydrogenase
MAQEEKIAIVTGAGRGIGRAIALSLARASYQLCLAARSFEELVETRNLSGLTPKRTLIVLADLADPDAPANLFDAALAHFGQIDVLVNNAGWAPARTPLAKTPPDDRDRMIAVNLRAPIALAQLAATHMIRRGNGVIISVASQAARTYPAGEAIYAAAKAGLVAFTHAAFAELRAQGVKTSVIIPGLTDTALIPPNKRLDRSAMLRPEDVARAIMSVIESPPEACPLEIVLAPSRDPMSPR